MPDIEHIVISGGCIWGLYQYGVLKYLHNQEFWNINNIKSVYATSAGTIVSTILAMRIDFETIDTYFIERPWHQLLNVNSQNILEAFNRCGIFHKEIFYELFKPIMKSIDMDIHITVKGFYEWTKIDMHFFITELNEFESIDINHSTYPEWKLIDAIYASCTIPVFFSPIIRGDKCYVDGLFFNNYPINPCILNIKDHDTILGICIDCDNDCTLSVTEESSIIDFTGILFNKIFNKIAFNENGKLKYEVIRKIPPVTIESIRDIANSKELRENMIRDGELDGVNYYNIWNSS